MSIRPLSVLACLTVAVALSQSAWGGDAPASTSQPAASLDAKAAKPSDRVDLSIFFENDGGFINPFNGTDRHYTNGVKFLAAFHPEWADDASKDIPFSFGNDKPDRSSVGLVFGQDLYTPWNQYQTALIPNDQPYAAWLYGGAFFQRADDNIFDHLELNIGMIGPSALGEQTQNNTHRIFGYDKWEGWDNQLHDEAAFDVIYQRRWRVYRANLWGNVDLDVIPHAGFTLGTLDRNADLGGTIRAGLNLPEDFNPGNIMFAPDYTSEKAPGKQVLYLFGRLNGRFVEHNTVLEGNNYRSSPGVSIEPVVGYATFGFEFDPFRCLSLSVSNTFKTHEFKGQDGTDSYGTALLTLHFDF